MDYGRKSRRGTKAIASYGIILFTGSLSNPKVLLYKRRDSYEYIDLLRGSWSHLDKALDIAKQLAVGERERLLSHSFDELWDDLWINHDCDIYARGKEPAREKFTRLMSVKSELMKFPVSNTEHQWSYPKGKKDKLINETNLECALRELEEETHIDMSGIKIVDSRPLEEIYAGGNKKAYRTDYYIAYSPVELAINRIQTPGCIRPDSVSEEASEVSWFTIDEALKKLPERRQKILQQAVGILTNIRVSK